jgi:hypothetical protein
MPSTSKKQHNLMEAVAHNPSFAKKVGIPRSVGEDFSKADKGKTFKKGGEMKKKMAGGGETMSPRSMKEDVEAGSNKHGKFGESKLQKKGHTKGKNLGDTGKKEPIESEKNMPSFMKEMKKGGKVKKMAAGGTASSRADGIAQRGKTVGKYC